MIAVRSGSAALAFLVAACASAPPAQRAGVEPTTVAAAVTVRQHLYRLTYDSGEGRTSLRVVLRLAGEERFQLTGADVAGRAVFGLDFAGESALLVDHRAKSYCVSGRDLRLASIHPSELPLAALPRVLRGLLPVEPDTLVPDPDGEGFLDARSRRWRVTREGERLEGWTLFDAEGPALWWTRRDDGGILSRRDGDQYRWTTIVVEDSDRPLADLVPSGYAEGVCDDSPRE